MSTKAARGTKRTCQNSECGSRFYDLNREPISCPVCAAIYVPTMVSPAVAAAQAAAERAAARKAKKPQFEPADTETPAVAPELEGEDVVVDDAETPAVAAEDDTFLEPEDVESGDMTNIIGGPVAEGEEES